jgi:hypothetical protein
MLKCEKCHCETRRLIIHEPAKQLWCDACKAETRGPFTQASAVIDDTIIGGFLQEHFGHTPEMFYSKKAMAKRADELGLRPFVRHTDGDKHTSRWI